MSLSFATRLTLYVALLLPTACAVLPVARPADAIASPSWRGRLALRLEADTENAQARSVTASFELSGSPQHGELTLYTPLGTTVAQLEWADQNAVLRRDGEVRRFVSLADLVGFALGTEVPVEALFAWLLGKPVSAAGWNADLSRHASGHILARRELPAPTAEIRLVLEK